MIYAYYHLVFLQWQSRAKWSETIVVEHLLELTLSALLLAVVLPDPGHSWQSGATISVAA